MYLSAHRLELLDNRTHVFKRFYVGNPELHAKFYFDRNDKINVVERVPVSNFIPSGIFCQNNGIIQQNIPENTGESVQNLLVRHYISPARAMWVSLLIYSDRSSAHRVAPFANVASVTSANPRLA